MRVMARVIAIAAPCALLLVRWGGRQLANGDVVFTHGGSLARFTSPLAHESSIVAPRAEYAGAIAETGSGDWLVSARAGAGAHYALKLWKPGTAALQTLLAQSGEDIVEPVLVTTQTTPKRHPSGLHDWSYANLLALDSCLSRESDDISLSSFDKCNLDGRRANCSDCSTHSWRASAVCPTTGSSI